MLSLIRTSLINTFSVFVFCLSAYSFQTNSLRVIVTDQNSDAVKDPTIRLTRGDILVREFKEFAEKAAIFSALSTGSYKLEVEAEGFTSLAESIEIKSGRNEILVQLQVAVIEENVDVGLSEQEKNLDIKNGGFSSVLTQQQIDALPEDRNELKQVLENMAGAGAEILIDGLSGQQIPNKDQIASIKIIRSSYDAEFHQVGRSYIEIISRAGGSKWNGSISFNFNDAIFNARQAFAVSRPPSQDRGINFGLSGPIIKDKASLTVFGIVSDNFSAADINAALPGGVFNESVKRKNRYIFYQGKLSYNLTKNHPLNISLQQNISKSENFGVGGTNLRERGANSEFRTTEVGVSTSGLIGKKYLHEFRAQFVGTSNESVPLNNETAIIVLDSFSGGGAGNDSTSKGRKLFIGENIVFGVKKHTFKFGGSVEYERQDLRSANNRNGTFIFSSLDDFINSTPSRYTQNLEERRIKLSQYQLAAYVQDDIKLHKTFMLNLGIRYEWQNNLRDKNNFSPRIGFSFSPSKEGKITFRGGAGLYYVWFQPDNYASILSNGIDQPGKITIINPGFPDPYIGGINQELVNSFWQLSPNLRAPYIISYSFGVSQRLNNTTNLSSIYAFERGVHQFRSRDINAPFENGLRPDPNFGSLQQVDSSAYFVRNSLSINLNTQPFKNSSLYVNYTLARKTSDADGIFSLPSDSYDLALDRGTSDDDNRHRFYGWFNWRVKKSISFSTNAFITSPNPYSITTGLDNNGDTIFNDRPFGVLRNSERGAWSINLGNSLSWTYAFGKADKPGGAGGGIVIMTSGSAPPNSSDKKKYSLQFSATSQNVINRVNHTGFVGVQTSPFFGRPVSASSPRRISFGVRFSF